MQREDRKVRASMACQHRRLVATAAHLCAAPTAAAVAGATIVHEEEFPEIIFQVPLSPSPFPSLSLLSLSVSLSLSSLSLSLSVSLSLSLSVSLSLCLCLCLCVSESPRWHRRCEVTTWRSSG
eukprot:COSAG03_NODE_2172_length_3049_cov_9.823390_5_plen_123_part_00